MSNIQLKASILPPGVGRACAWSAAALSERSYVGGEPRLAEPGGRLKTSCFKRVLGSRKSLVGVAGDHCPRHDYHVKVGSVAVAAARVLGALGLRIRSTTLVEFRRRTFRRHRESARRRWARHPGGAAP